MGYSKFEDFWPDYVRAHSNKLNRTLHVIGVGLALACAFAAIKKKKPWLLLGVPVLGYGFAWAGHFFAEHNAPATFSHPLYSLRASGLLLWMTINGTIEAELARVLQDDKSQPSSDNASAESAAN
jgi:hypothetical protein